MRPTTKSAPEFGRRLASARQKAGLTQAELAAKLGLSVKTMDHYERRCSNPSLKFLRSIADILGVPITDLVNGEHQPLRRSKTGPVPKLERHFARVRKLPLKKQKAIISMLDLVLEKGSASHEQE